MANLYRQFCLQFLGGFLLILGLATHPLNAQQTLPGVVRIKVTESLASTLEQQTLSQNISGGIVTGVQSLDQLSKQFNVRKYERVFPHAGKHETRHKRYGLHLWYQVSLDKSLPVSQVLQSYQSATQILRVEPVYKKTLIGPQSAAGPVVIKEDDAPGMLLGRSNDPRLSSQWHYHNTGQSGGTPGADIRLIDAWKIETGKSDVVVAITDGGVDVTHPDLAANLWINNGEIAGNKLDDDNNGYVDDVHGYSFVNRTGKILADNHGTHVAGTVGAVTNNSKGVAGVAGGSGTGDGIRIMSCAVFHADTLADGFAEAYVYSADNGAVISQNSWGYTMPNVFEQVVLDAIDYFIAEAGKNELGQQTGPMNGGLAFFSAGNYNDEGKFYPASYEPVIAVASSTHKDKRAQYSNFGTWVDITAPGGETYEEMQEGVISTLPGDNYGWYMGTSMACPHISGVAGLIVSRFGRPGLTAQTVRQRLLQSVDNIDPINPGFEGKLGSGRVNAFLALRTGDQLAPAAITDLKALSKDVGQITLGWTAPGDGADYVTAYDLRFSTSPITENTFENATVVQGLSQPKAPGSAETFTIDKLSGGVTYYFAIRSQDFEGNYSKISNVVAETSARTPLITVSPKTLTKNLQTAEVSSAVLTIANEGEGPLKYTIAVGESAHSFASVQSSEGNVLAGSTKAVTVTFNAAGLLAGTYRQVLKIASNDPANPQISVALTLNVTNNGAPIASVSPELLDFKSVQVRHSQTRKLVISNAGSEALVVSKISSSHPAFRAATKGSITVRSFEKVEAEIVFSPSNVGVFSGEVVLHVNDPANPALSVPVKGEGLDEAPVVASPQSFNESLARGTTAVRTVTLQNNGSYDRTYRIEVAENHIVSRTGSKSSRNTTRQAADSDSSRAQQARKLNRHKLALTKKGAREVALVKTVGIGSASKVTASTAGRRTQSENAALTQYQTGFEEFNTGAAGEQHGWSTTQGWTINSDNPDEGAKHLRGISEGSGDGEKYALSPYLYDASEYYPHYTSASMRINADGAKGSSWEVVPQDPWSYIATRIRFNANGTIDAFVIDNNYEFHWKRVPAQVPSGYFDLAIEYNNWGSDTSGFPTYHLFINSHHVFSGTGLGSGIGQIAFVSPMENVGPIFDIDAFRLMGGEYVPHFMSPTPVQGSIPAGGSANVNVEFDARVIKYGTYASDMLVHLDETDTVKVPAVLTVTGPPSMTWDLWAVNMELEDSEGGWQEMILTNTGGRDISYNFETDVAGLTVSPASGTLAVRENKPITITFTGTPGLYAGQLTLHNDAGDDVIFPVSITVFETNSEFISPKQVKLDISAGYVTTKSISLKNLGTNAVTFHTATTPESQGFMSIEPAAATFEDSLDLIVTFDARELSSGTKHWWVEFTTNDPEHTRVFTSILLNVAPDTVTGGTVTREVWTDVQGNEISSIPLNRAPNHTTQLKSFESPANEANNYGSRMRGYVRPPNSGYYTFFIASDENSELWLSEDENEKNKRRIAWVSGATNLRQWDKYPSQQSEIIYLEANRKYYIEALHKEATGSDHLSVGWHEDEMSFERPIPGSRLIPYNVLVSNASPEIEITSPADGQNFPAPANILVTTRTQDMDGNIVKVEFFSGGSKLGSDITAPFEFSWNNVPEGSYSLSVKATDNRGATDSTAVEIAVGEKQSCAGAGMITREQWNNVKGTRISDIPLNSPPSETKTLSTFESARDIADDYGARIRGYVCVPESGEYTFWIASNDRSELWLSTDASPVNKVRIAHVPEATKERQWKKHSTQQSKRIFLQKGTRYYIEALHKEGADKDHLAVGWQLPDGTLERPIPGKRLLPFETLEAFSISLTSPANGHAFISPANVEISAAVTGSANNVKVEFFNGSEKLGEDVSAPYAFIWTNVQAGNYSITARATNNVGDVAMSNPVEISVEANCTASGTITRERWRKLKGTSLSNIPLHAPPDAIQELTIFETSSSGLSNYGDRIRGYICPPETGDYFFWISSSDQSELWLSTDEDPSNTKRIAMVRGGTSAREWDKYPFQSSHGIRLKKGQTYYIEALHKHNKGAGHIAVGWQLPDGTLERPIAGSRLSPFSSGTVLPSEGEIDSGEADMLYEKIDVRVYPNPVAGETLNIVINNDALPEEATREILIRQLTGVAVYSEKVTCTETCSAEVDVRKNLPPGVYILQVRVGEQMFTEKLLVK